MAGWICDECGHHVSGWEGERGTYHGVCKHCGEGVLDQLFEIGRAHV